MKHRFGITFFGVIAFWVVGFSPALANTVIVCGTDIDDSSGTMSWSAFSQGPGKPYIERGDAKGLFHELQQLLTEQAIAWPKEVKSPVMNSITGLNSGEASLSDFKVTKDVSGLRAKQVIFQNTPNALEIPPNSDNESCQMAPQKEALIAATQFTILVERSGAEILSDAFKRTAEVAQMLEGIYDKYLYEGFPMYPWEALANSWFLTDESIANGPPRDQMVLMHLGAGVVGAFGSGSNTDIAAVLSLEPIGWVHYTRDYDTWYGVSLLTVFPFDRNLGVGVGFIINNFKLGITWHDYGNSNYKDPTYFIGFELYQFVDKSHRNYNAYQNKAEGILTELN